jgi:amidase/aspartyl-tRNA(Asn)/glutamyl-tRNA(Gln) amidotransferase subunit A
MPNDLIDARAEVLSGRISARSSIERSIATATSAANARTFVATSFAAARAAAAAADGAVAAGRDPGSLAGLAVSIKDLFDVAGEVTAAGSTILAKAPAVTADAPAVARLRRAGAAFIGRTNMSEFAFSGVGINPHHGTPANPATASLDAAPRIPGGSSSGGAVSVATGAAWVGLGSDTGGSIRIPAALQGLVGFKSTARLVPTEGAVPLSTTLDTVSAMTRSVRDAIAVHEILADRRVATSGRPFEALHLAVPRTILLEGLDATVARAFARALGTLSARGARIEEINLPLLGEVAAINATGGFAAAESWAWHRHRLAGHEAEYDPRVARRIRRGEAMTAPDYIELLAARRGWIARMEASLARFDALLSPTVPIVAPELAPLVADDDAFFAVNAALLRNPSIVNLLDGCALTVPCHHEGELPAGLMAWHAALHDDTILDVGLAVEAALRSARNDAAPR